MTIRELGEQSWAVDPAQAQSPPDSSSDPVGDWSPESLLPANGIRRKAFLLLNAWLAFHLFAIFICPASVEPSSPLVRSAFRFVAPYLLSLYMDHGFHFFVPDPGASTLVAYSLELPDGSTKTGRFPDRATFPRLFYHRYFMLSEFLGNGPEDLMPFVERAFARNLCRETGAVRVTLTRVVHDTAPEDAILRGRSLNDPAFFTETLLGTYTPEELKLPFELPLKDSESPKDDMPVSQDERKGSP